MIVFHDRKLIDGWCQPLALAEREKAMQALYRRLARPYDVEDFTSYFASFPVTVRIRALASFQVRMRGVGCGSQPVML